MLSCTLDGLSQAIRCPRRVGWSGRTSDLSWMEAPRNGRVCGWAYLRVNLTPHLFWKLYRNNKKGQHQLHGLLGRGGGWGELLLKQRSTRLGPSSSSRGKLYFYHVDDIANIPRIQPENGGWGFTIEKGSTNQTDPKFSDPYCRISFLLSPLQLTRTPQDHEDSDESGPCACRTLNTLLPPRKILNKLLPPRT